MSANGTYADTWHNRSFWRLVSGNLFSKNKLKELVRQMLLGNMDSLQEDSILNRAQSVWR